MVASRIYYNNLLTQQRFSSFSVAGGAVAMADSGWSPYYDFSAGNAQIVLTGTYTGNFEADYLAEIHSSTNGTFSGSRWRWSDTGGAVWNVENIQPVSGVPVALNNGLILTFNQSGVGPEFVVGDYWYARAIRPYGIAKALDGSRNSEYRSGTTPASSTIRAGWDLGSTQQPTLFVLEDHNIPSNAVTTLWGNTALFTESGGFSMICTWRANRIAELITSSAFRYWWVKVVMPASGSLPAYLRYSNMFLGTGATLSKCPDIGFSNDLEWLGSIDMENIATRGPHPRVYTAAQPQYTWSGVKEDATEDGGKLAAALAYARDHASYTMPPFYFILRDDVPGTVEYYSWVGSGLQRRNRFLDRFDYSVQWAQVIRTAA